MSILTAGGSTVSNVYFQIILAVLGYILFEFVRIFLRGRETFE
jgi:hypothetical protein